MWSVQLVFCDCGSPSVWPLMDKDKRLRESSWKRDWLWGKLGLILMGGAMLSKSLIQFSVDGRDLVPSLLLDLRPNYGGGNEDNGDLLQKVPYMRCPTQCPWCCSRPPPTHASTGDSWILTGKSGSVSCGVTPPFSWVLVHRRFCLCPPRFVSPVLCKFCNQILLASKNKFPVGSQSLCQIPKLGSVLWGLEFLQQYENFFGVFDWPVTCCLISIYLWIF